MAIVTSMSRKEAWNLIPTLQSLARETGMTTTGIAALTTEYLKQGKSLNEAIVLTEAAAKAAKIAGISASDSVKYLTAALNGFSLAADKAMEVSDKFAALAAASATDYEQLAVGMSKFASQAKLAGLSMDFALGMLAKGVETTQEAPESIGTALKTVLARMRELTDYGKTLEDGMDLNRVETALRQVGIQLRDTNGTFRDMESVLKEVGNRWETLNTNQQASVAVAMAGTRQQSRLISMFQEFDRTLELVNESQEAAGATEAQHAEYMKGMEGSMVALQNAWQKFITSITDSDIIISSIKAITWGIDVLSEGMEALGAFGNNFMVILMGVIAIKKIYNVVSAISSKLALNEAAAEAILTKEKEQGLAVSIVRDKITSFGIIKNVISAITTYGLAKAHKILNEELKRGSLAWFTYWSVATLGIVALVGAIVLITVGIVKLIKYQNEAINRTKEHVQEIRNLRYEINQTVKGFDSLIDKYDEINSKSIQTEEDIQELQRLEDELKTIDGLKIEYLPNMEMDLDATIKKFRKIKKSKRRNF